MSAAPEIRISDLSLDKILGVFDSPEDIPGDLRVQLVDYCNESCFFCHNEGTEVRYRGIDQDLMWKVIAASAEIGKKLFRFTGGEPTLHKQFSEIIQRLRDAYPDANMGFTTNGTRLKKISPGVFRGGVDKINVSLHSSDRREYERITKKDYLPRVLEGLDYLDSLGFRNVTLNVVADMNNIGEIRELAAFAVGRGYEVNVLDIIGSASRNAASLSWAQLNMQVDDVVAQLGEEARIKMKSKNYHPKCNDCTSKPICGEGEYLRLNIPNLLVPCMYRPDLFIVAGVTDSREMLAKKVALGYRRIVHDSL